MADGFLGRWSRRKAGKEVEKADEAEKLAPLENISKASEGMSQTSPVEVSPAVLPPPTLEDVAKLDRFDPDFSAFMKADVDPAVQQAALKKMFTDPHFNIMDGLDIYIDDYSKPDPLPPGMLERMVQSDMLKLFSQPSEEQSPEIEQSSGDDTKPQLASDATEAAGQSDLTSMQPEQKKT